MKGSITRHEGVRGAVWRGVVDVGRDPVTGKRRQIKVTAPTKREVQAKIAEALHKANTGAYVTDSKTPSASTCGNGSTPGPRRSAPGRTAASNGASGSTSRPTGSGRPRSTS